MPDEPQKPTDEQIGVQPLVGAVTESKPKEVNDNVARSLGDRYAMARQCVGLELPLILHQQCYEYMGQPVEIIEANVYDTIGRAEVVIESSGDHRTQVEFRDLDWLYSRTTKDAVCQKPRDEYILYGE